MNSVKIKELLRIIEGIRGRKYIANYIPSFTLESFPTSVNPKDKLLKYLTNTNYPDDEVSVELTQLTDWKTFFRHQVKHFLLDPPDFVDSKRHESDEELKQLVDELELEMMRLEPYECYEVKSTHKRFYDLVWTDMLFIISTETYFLHLGFSD